jgi:hypothetical protein
MNEFLREQFVTKEIAQQLRDVGYNEECFGYYQNAELIINALSNYELDKHNLGISAPLWQQVIDWLREKHNLRIFESTPICGQSSKSFNEDFRFELVKISGNGGHVNSVYGNGGLGSRYQTYSSYNEARQAVIEHALTLI